MIPTEYTQAAYLKAIAQQVQRDVKERYVDGDTPAQQTIICEEVFHADREVTQTALLEFLEILQQISDKAEKRMTKFEFRKKAALTVKLPPVKGDADE
jgi:hypothetical protein